MTPDDAQAPKEPEPIATGDEHGPFGSDYLNWKPTTPEDFGPGEEWIRDEFFERLAEQEESHAEWEKQEALRRAAEGDK